jgi:hypothetical protein
VGHNSLDLAYRNLASQNHWDSFLPSEATDCRRLGGKIFPHLNSFDNTGPALQTGITQYELIWKRNHNVRSRDRDYH